MKINVKFGLKKYEHNDLTKKFKYQYLEKKYL